MDLTLAKRAAALHAAALIESGMVVGLGSGSTALYFIDYLIERCHQGIQIKTVASSAESAEKAKNGGIPVFDLNEMAHIDLTVDGADEIDLKKRLIKGGGGAHVREKILASSSAEMIVIVDESKLVSSIGQKKLPIEILPYGSLHTVKKIEQLGYLGKWRCALPSQLSQELFVTENGNFLFDVIFKTPPENPEKMNEELLHIPGVVDTGFFFSMAKRVIVGKKDGTTTLF